MKAPSIGTNVGFFGWLNIKAVYLNSDCCHVYASSYDDAGHFSHGERRRKDLIQSQNERPRPPPPLCSSLLQLRTNLLPMHGKSISCPIRNCIQHGRQSPHTDRLFIWRPHWNARWRVQIVFWAALFQVLATPSYVSTTILTTEPGQERHFKPSLRWMPFNARSGNRSNSTHRTKAKCE